MSALDHPAFDAAVEWIVKTPRESRMRATVALLRETFGLSAVDACEAIRRANARRYGLDEGSAS
jgi:hypothetical protein